MEATKIATIALISLLAAISPGPQVTCKVKALQDKQDRGAAR